MNSIVKAAVISVVLVVLIVLGAFLLLQEKKSDVPEEQKVAVKEEKPGPGKKILPPKDTGPLIQKKAGEVSFKVRVLDGATKNLLPKASLFVHKISEGDRPGVMVFESGRLGAGAATGEFQLSAIPGIYQVRAQCPGYTSRTERLTLAKDRSPVLTLELDRGNSISGRILTREGQGIGGARVLAYHQLGDPNESQIERFLKIIEIPKWEAPSETVSAADGSYQIDGLKKEHYTVKALAAGYSPGERTNILPTKDNVNIELPLGSVLTGAVVDKSGAGVPGAKVMAYTHTDSADLFTIIATRSRPPMETAVADAAGSFKFENLGVGTYNFIAAAKGFQEGRFQKIRIREGDNPPQRFPVTKGLAIAGTVVSPSGEPLNGARVRATRIGDTGRNEQIFIKFDDGSIVTDAKGEFSYDTLEPGKYTLLAWHTDYATEQLRDIEAGTEGLTITLPVGGAISGKITEAGTGNPIPGARIVVNDMQDLKKEDISDDKGEYYVVGLNSMGQGRKYLAVQAEGYARISNIQINVEENKVIQNQNFELQRTALVSGRVVNKAGDGVSGARVMARRKAQNAAVPVTVGAAVTDGDGRYKISDLEAGEETQLSVWTSEYLEGLSDLFSVQAGDSVEIPAIVLQLGGVIEGVVVGPDGRGIGGVQISVREESKTSPDAALGASSDNSGKFKIKGLPAGTLDLVARSNQYLEEVVTGVKVAEASLTSDVRIVLKKGSSVKGIVVDSSGQPVRGAQVSASDISTSGMREVRVESDQDGNFALENILSTEDLEIEVEHAEFGSISLKVPVNSEDVKIELPKLGGVRAVVVDPEGRPVPSFSVQPVPKGEGAEGKGKKLSPKTYSATADGTFEYTGIPLGAYDINIRAPSFSAFTFPDVRVSAEVIDLGKAVLQEGGVVSGIVSDSSGAPIQGATVRVIGGLGKFDLKSVSGKAQPDQSVASTDARGAFEFRNLKSGVLSLQVSAKGYVSRRVENIDSNTSTKARDVKVVLEVGSEIIGQVVDAAGSPKNGAQVYLNADRPEGNQRTTTNSEGTFHFIGLASGNYRITVQHLGGAGQNPSVELTLGPSEQQDVGTLVLE